MDGQWENGLSRGLGSIASRGGEGLMKLLISYLIREMAVHRGPQDRSRTADAGQMCA